MAWLVRKADDFPAPLEHDRFRQGKFLTRLNLEQVGRPDFGTGALCRQSGCWLQSSSGFLPVYGGREIRSGLFFSGLTSDLRYGDKLGKPVCRHSV